jgi:uncharacterized delta-60 repeat protein
MAATRRRNRFGVALTCAFFALSASSVLAAPGDLDTSFGGDGRVTTNLTKGSDGALDVAVQANGRIVVVGRASSKHSYGRFAVLRYKSNGTLDASFGGDGKVITNFAKREDLANAVAIQDNGRIVAPGAPAGARSTGSSLSLDTGRTERSTRASAATAR